MPDRVSAQQVDVAGYRVNCTFCGRVHLIEINVVWCEYIRLARPSGRIRAIQSDQNVS